MDAAAAMGRAVQKNQEAGELNLRIKGEYDRVRQEAKDHAPVRTQILLWNTPLLTVNFDTYASKLIESCGGWNVFHEDPVREIPIDLEDMIEKNPELFKKIAEEAQEKMKAGGNQMDTVMEVLKSHEEELKKLNQN